MVTRQATPEEIAADPQTFYMSEDAFNSGWRPIVKEPYAAYGRPFSLNLLWYAP